VENGFSQFFVALDDRFVKCLVRADSFGEQPPRRVDGQRYGAGRR
jgi:hypothetical protein